MTQCFFFFQHLHCISCTKFQEDRTRTSTFFFFHYNSWEAKMQYSSFEWNSGQQPIWTIANQDSFCLPVASLETDSSLAKWVGIETERQTWSPKCAKLKWDVLGWKAHNSGTMQPTSFWRKMLKKTTVPKFYFTRFWVTIITGVSLMCHFDYEGVLKKMYSRIL